MTITRPPGDTRAADDSPRDSPELLPDIPAVEAVAGGDTVPFSGTPQAVPPVEPTRQAAGRTGPGRHILGPLILIALGVVFLIGNYVTSLGSLFFLALGAAFLVARVVQRQYGLAVPAGILLGFGTFVALTENGQLADTGTDTAQGGWFFLLLGAGFLLVYAIGARSALIWPLFPAAILTGFGMLLIGQDNLAWFARLGRLTDFWPLALVGIGLWLLVRPRLALGLRRPVGAIALALLLVYGLGLLAGGIATANLQFGVPGSGLRGFGFRAPISETRSLTAPIGAGETFRVNNMGGNTIVRDGAPGTVQVTATTYRWADDQTLDVRLTQEGGTVTLAAILGDKRYFGTTPYVDYTIAVPPGVRVEATSASGNLAISGVGGAVVAITSSGALTLDDIGGAVTARSSSGDQRLTNIAGELRATSSSGNIAATGIAQPREFVVTSGNVTAEGRFADDARIVASSGNVTVRFAPESTVQITATTSSGAIRVGDLALSDRREATHALSGTLGGGAGTLIVQASSGNVTLTSR